MVAGGSTEKISVLRTPEEAGVYTVKIFVWDGISFAPQPLSQVTVKNLSDRVGHEGINIIYINNR